MSVADALSRQPEEQPRTAGEEAPDEVALGAARGFLHGQAAFEAAWLDHLASFDAREPGSETPGRAREARPRKSGHRSRSDRAGRRARSVR
jgi:hypothetical protein